jgi:hypothetical protein
MKIIQLIIFLTATLSALTQAADTSVDMNSSAIKGWATGYQSLSYGSDVDDIWKTPQKALGKATGDAFDIVSLGNGGQITLTFSRGISNGSGYDLAIFENGMSSSFLELAWVEVSSDGTHFVRFFNFSLNSGPIGAFGSVDPSKISGLASKYQKGYGTQFDLQQLQDIYNNPNDPSLSLTADFKNQLLTNFPYLDLNNIRYVRIIDIVGDGSARDAMGHIIYDPYRTIGSGGFDLEAAAVLHTGTTPPEPTFQNWAVDYNLSGDPAADKDGDGSSDIEEYFFGTSPTNASDLATFNASSDQGDFRISFNRNPNAIGKVQVESSSSLRLVNWNILTPSSVSSNGTLVTFTLPLDSSQCFYRLRFEGTK